MCYYNGVKVTHSEYIRLKTIEKAIAQYDFLSRPLHIGFDYSGIPVLKRFPHVEDFDIIQMEWGFLPPSVFDREAAEKFRNGYTNLQGKFIKGYTTLNAKAENLFLNEYGRESIFADAARKRRCLILSTGFYEWRHIYPKNKRTGEPLKTAVKYPYRIGLKDQEYFYMAGIYTPWTDKKTGETVETCAITTTDANSPMRQIHNSKERMPTILTEDLAWEWMFGNLTDERITEIAKWRLPGKMMDGCTIRKDFKEAYNPAEQFEYQGLQPIDYDLPD